MEGIVTAHPEMPEFEFDPIKQSLPTSKHSYLAD